MTFRRFFHYLSYLQYPLMLTALLLAFKPYINGLEAIKQNPDLYFENVNTMLIFLGLGINFSSLQNTTKTQNRFSRNIYEVPYIGKYFIVLVFLMIGFFLGTGLLGFFSIKNKIINELSVGLIILGLGMFGFLKAAVEMFENHRLDKNPDTKKH